jgi:serine/threonine protein kinase
MQISKVLALHLRINHPNIIRIYDVFADESYVYVVEEFMESGTLEQLIGKNKAPLKESEVGEKVCEIVGAAKYIHGRNYIHGGLKPASILICLVWNWFM